MGISSEKCAVRDELRVAFSRQIKPAALVLAFFFGVIALIHYLYLSPQVAWIMSLTALGTAIVSGALGLWGPMSVRTSPWIAMIIAIMVGANCFLHLYLENDPKQSTNLMLFLIGCGALFLNHRLMLAIILATMGLWGYLARKSAGMSDIWFHFGFMMVIAAFFAYIIMLLRLKVITELIESRITLQRRSEDLATTLEKVEKEVALRTAAEERLQAAYEEISQLAITDGLTRVSNRRKIDEFMRHEWQRLGRSQKPLAVIICDIDYFKRYNDELGHQQGDRALMAVAEILRSGAQRPSDLVGRYGGEEFIVALPETPLESAFHVASRLWTKVNTANIPHPASAVAHHLTCSFGVAAMIPDEANAPGLLIEQADKALYLAKSEGRNRLVLDPGEESA